jgi:hypothetical protein
MRSNTCLGAGWDCHTERSTPSLLADVVLWKSSGNTPVQQKQCLFQANARRIQSEEIR